MHRKELPALPILLFIITLGFSLSYLSYSVAETAERHKLQIEFDRHVDLYVAEFKQEMSINIELMHNLKGLFLASSEVDRDEFRTYTIAILARHSTLHALEWVPLVKKDERDHYEALARENGLNTFTFTEQGVDGTLSRAAIKDQYFPVYYVEPYDANEAVAGFDLASNPTRLKTLNESRDTGLVLASAPVDLVQSERALAQGILLFVPIYQGQPNAVDERRGNLKGFAVGVLRIKELLDNVIRHTRGFTPDIAIELFDLSEADEPKLIYQFPAESASLAATSSVESIAKTQELEVGGRKWLFKAKPLPDFVNDLNLWPAYSVFFGGSILTMLIALYVRLVMSREKSVRALVTSHSNQLVSNIKRTKVIIDTALEPIITIDSGGLIQTFNPAAEKLFGYQAQEVQQKNVKILMPAPYRDEHDGYLSHYRQTKNPKIIGSGREVTGQRKDGTTFPMFLSVSEAELDGELIFVGVIVDLTLQKKSEQILVEAKENAERMNRSKSEFLNMMSHELRTPLTVILGYLPILKNKEALPDPEMIAELAGDMEESGLHLLTLINDLLDISKIEAGKMILKKERLTTKVVVNDAISALKHTAVVKNIALINRADDLELVADPIRIKQILINLIGNALKFTKQGSITIAAEQLDNGVEFTVSDTGCGIAEHELQSIFEKFHQVDSTSTRATGGTGLGLAITRKLVELHGGTIRASSQLNQGSTFTFTITQETGNL